MSPHRLVQPSLGFLVLILAYPWGATLLRYPPYSPHTTRVHGKLEELLVGLGRREVVWKLTRVI